MQDNGLHWIFTVSGKKITYVIFLVFAQGLYGASGVIYALLLRNIVDHAVEQDSAGFWKYILLSVLLVAIQLILRAVVRWLTERSKSSYENVFKLRLMKMLLTKDYAIISAVHSGEWLNRLTNDAIVAADNFVEILPGLAGMVVKLVSALFMIILLKPDFAVILIPGGTMLIFFTWLFRKVLKSLHKSVQEADGRLRIFFQERITSMIMIRSFAAEKRTIEETKKKLNAHKDARMKKNHFSNLCNIGFGIAMNGMYLLGIGWCGYGILKGTITFGTLTAITQLISQIQSPFANITGYLPRYYTMLASAERLMEIEELKEENNRIMHERKNMSEILSVGIHDVTFAYYPPTEKFVTLSKEMIPPVLKNLSLEIRKGEYVALTGNSGCGKSTVLKLLMGVYAPDQGICFLKDKRGNIEKLTSDYRHLFAYVPQGNQLMNGTIRDIVSFPDPSASQDEERLHKALSIACAWDFVMELKDGMDTLLGERGTGLSEGQMQRLAIARAVFSERPILLLDEATSALDEENEAKLLCNFRTISDRTVIIVTHRSKTLSICDRQLIMVEDGIRNRKLS